MTRITIAAAAFFASISVTNLASQARVAPAGQAPAGLPGVAPVASAATYVGSATCRRCHAPIYERWSKTRMANVVVDPKAHPEAVLLTLIRPIRS